MPCFSLPPPGVSYLYFILFYFNHQDNVVSSRPPVLKLRVIPPEQVVVDSSNSKVLECEAGGNPSPTIHWLKNGKLISQVTLYYFLLLVLFLNKSFPPAGLTRCSCSWKRGEPSSHVRFRVHSVSTVPGLPSTPGWRGIHLCGRQCFWEEKRQYKCQDSRCLERWLVFRIICQQHCILCH